MRIVFSGFPRFSCRYISVRVVSSFMDVSSCLSLFMRRDSLIGFLDRK